MKLPWAIRCQQACFVDSSSVTLSSCNFKLGGIKMPQESVGQLAGIFQQILFKIVSR